MNKKCKKACILLFSFVAAIIMCFSVIFLNNTTALAQQNVIFEMVDGAGVRVNDPTGMRFKTRFSKDYYDELTTTDASLFVAIFPYTDYSAYQVSNKDMPDWLEEKYGAGKYINIEISEESFYTIAEDDCYYANAVISNLYFNNYHREFVGISYIRRGTAGAYSYEYTTITEEDNARSIYEVVCKANMDAEDHAKYGDTLEVMIKNGLYGAYGVSYDKNAKTYSLDGNTYTSIEALENEVKVDQATLSLGDEALTVGTSKKLIPVFTYQDGTVLDKDAVFTWSSSTPEVATIDEDGLVSAIAAGETTITVTACGGLYATECTVRVSKITPVGTIIQDCVYDEGGAGFTVSDEIAVAPGFERLYKHESNAEFIHGLNFSGVNLDNYSLVTFAIKTANFNMNSEGANTSNEWLVFTLTQVSPDTWDLVVTQNGETVYTKAGLNGAYATNDAYTDNALDAILYGNPSGFSPTGVDGNLLIYVTELRGVEKSIEPVGTIIQDCVFDITDFNTGTSFAVSTEIATANGFEKLYKYENAGQESLHGGNWSGVNLDNYSLVTFAIKTAKFNFNNESNDTSNKWLVFTLTQTDTAVWTLVVTKNGEVVYEKAGLSGNRETGGAYVYNALDAILYGVPSQGYTAWGVDGNLLIYVTELRGVLA